MKKLIFTISIILFAVSVCIAQSQFQYFAREGVAYSIIQTTDGGYAVAGENDSLGAGTGDMYIVKLSSTGSLQWSKTVGGTREDIAQSIIQTTDGGFAVAGATESFPAGNNWNMYIVKLSSTGSLQWSKTGGGTYSDYAQSIIQTTDGGYAVAGYTGNFGVGESNMYIVKLASDGSLQWAKAVGGTHFDYAQSIIQTKDGGYAIAGATSSFPVEFYYHMYIVKLSSNGSLQWSKTVGGTSTSTGEWAYSIIQTTDSGYAVAGYTNSFGAGSTDMYIVKLASDGSLQWSKTVGGSLSDYAYSIIQTTDGGYAVAGNTFSFGAGLGDMYIVKLDSNGSLQWSKAVGGTQQDLAYSIIQTTDGGYAVAGNTQSFGLGSLFSMYIVKLDANGNTCGNSTSPSSISGTGGTETSPSSIVTTVNPTLSTPSSQVSNGVILTPICVIGIKPISTKIPNSFSLYQNYPNPFNPSTNIRYDLPKSGFVKLVVYDVLGHEVATLVNEKLNAGIYEIEWNASNYPSGIYFYKLMTTDFSITRKMVLIK